MPKKINYFARNFADYRQELINFIRQFYPDILSDFNDASVGSLFIDLVAGIGDNLSFHIDRSFQETQLDFMQEKKSLLSLARTFGLKVPGKRPSITLVDWSVIVPVLGDTFDSRYAPIIRKGAQVSGGGQVFESMDDIDFSSDFTTGGIPNRLVIPNFDSNGNIRNYTLTKREIMINGVTKVFKRVVTEQDIRPFLEVILPDDDVLSIDSIITLEGTNFSRIPTLDEFLNFDNRWFEVNALVENKIFIEDTTRVSDNAGIKPGKFERINRRFITEYTDNGFLKLIFGGGTQDVSSICDFNINDSLANKIGDIINNLSLGETPRPSTTMFVRYRVGGGGNTNIGVNILRSVGIADVIVSGPDSAINATVSASVTVNNPVPAFGGKDSPSTEEIRNLIRYNFSAQNRCVTIKDYLSRVALMPGEFGVPFRNSVFEEQNKIVISILNLDSNGKLTNVSTNTLRENIANYLADFRMLNDYVVVDNGKIINIAFDVDLFIDKQFSRSEIITNVINKITDFFDINKHHMGENIYLSQLLEDINNIEGVLNVIEIRAFNKVGEGKYSLNEIAQPYLDESTRQIDLLGEFTLFSEPNSMFELKFPEKDIRVRFKN